MGGVYPEVAERKEHIRNVVRAEEERFYETLAAGTERLLEKIEGLKKRNPHPAPAKKLSCFMTPLAFPWISLKKS